MRNISPNVYGTEQQCNKQLLQKALLGGSVLILLSNGQQSFTFNKVFRWPSSEAVQTKLSPVV